MPLDPVLANGFAPLKLDDPMDQMGEALTNAVMMDKMDTSRRTREHDAAVSQALKNATNQQGVTDRAKARYEMAQSGVGSAAIETDKGWATNDHLNAQTDHQKALAVQARINARGKLFENTQKELGSVTEDPRKGPFQMLKVFENTYPDLVETMGEERAAAVLQQRVDALKAAVTGGTWKDHRRAELLGAEKALKRHFDEVGFGDHKEIQSFDEFGGGNRRTEYSGKVGIDPNAVMQERGRNVRQVVQQKHELVKQDDQQNFTNALTTRKFDNQDVNREDNQGFQQAQQNRMFGQQNFSREDNQVAQSEAAATRAAAATTAAEKRKRDKQNEAQSIGASIVARELHDKFPEFQPQGVMGKEGDEGWIKLNMLPPGRAGAPDKLELQMFKKYLASKGMMFVQGDVGRPSWAVPATRMDAQTLRKGPSATKHPKLVPDKDGILVEAKPGVQVRTPSAAKPPDFDKKAERTYNMLYKDSGLVGGSGAKIVEMEKIRRYHKAQWEHDFNGGPLPTIDFGPSGAEDVIRMKNALQQMRLEDSQIRRNNALAEKRGAK